MIFIHKLSTIDYRDKRIFGCKLLNVEQIKILHYNSIYSIIKFFRLTTVTTRIVYKIRGSSFSSKNLNLEWIKNAN